jgi:hypothetical protein
MHTTACFNPTYIGKPVPRENHVPVVDASPQPTFEPLQANVGGDCSPLAFVINQLEDADGDTLTLTPPMVLSEAQADGFADALRGSLDAVVPGP